MTETLPPIRMRSKSRPTDVTVTYKDLLEAYSFVHEKPSLIHDISMPYLVYPYKLGLEGKGEKLVQPRIVVELSQSDGGIEILEMNIEGRIGRAPRNMPSKTQGLVGVQTDYKSYKKLIFQVEDYYKDDVYDRGLVWLDVTDPKSPIYELDIIITPGTNPTVDQLIDRHIKTQEYVTAELKNFLDKFSA